MTGLPMLISGGCKMGKSTLAQRLIAACHGPRFYIATMRPRDDEDLARIKRHQEERAGMGFETVECPTASDLIRLSIELPAQASLLLDSTTALLAEEMFGEEGTQDTDAAMRVIQAVTALCRTHPRAVFVSDAIYSDARRFDPATEAYRRGLAQVDRALAAQCATVVEMTFGIAVYHKGAASTCA